VIRDGLLVVTGGLAAGLLAASWFAQTLTGLLYEVHPADPLALSVVALVLAVVGLFAAYLPARRAVRINAVDALRVD
jgi:ABC-type antimicrobial peptide transport system permease subunit